jgi:hypothetical protein
MSGCLSCGPCRPTPSAASAAPLPYPVPAGFECLECLARTLGPVVVTSNRDTECRDQPRQLPQYEPADDDEGQNLAVTGQGRDDVSPIHRILPGRPKKRSTLGDLMVSGPSRIHYPANSGLPGASLGGWLRTRRDTHESRYQIPAYRHLGPRHLIRSMRSPAADAVHLRVLLTAVGGQLPLNPAITWPDGADQLIWAPQLMGAEESPAAQSGDRVRPWWAAAAARGRARHRRAEAAAGRRWVR